MGGLLSTPTPPPIPATPKPTDQDRESAREQARKDALERRRRGRAGTILTSERGLNLLGGAKAGQKDLLGE